jgi:hypothetical protein
MEWAKVFEILKLPTKFIVPIFLVATGLILLPESALESMRLKEFSDNYGLYFGIASLASGSLLLTEIFTTIWHFVKKLLSKAKYRKKIADRMLQLDASEKSVLREFYLQSQNTIKLPIDHPVVAGLMRSGVVVQVGAHGRRSVAGLVFSMKIADEAEKHITHDLIDFPEGELTFEDEQFLINNRPQFMRSIQREESIFNY